MPKFEEFHEFSDESCGDLFPTLSAHPAVAARISTFPGDGLGELEGDEAEEWSVEKTQVGKTQEKRKRTH